MLVKGITECHPQICCFGMRIILSWGQLRNSRHKRNSLLSPFQLKVHKFSFLKVTLISLYEGVVSPLFSTRRRTILTTGDKKSALRWVCINKPYWNNSNVPFVSPIYLPSQNLLPLEAQIHFSLSRHFPTTYYSLLK